MSGTLVKCFDTFLKNISLTKGQKDELVKNYNAFCKKLQNDRTLSPAIEEIRLQGSFQRKTIIRPKNGRRSDIDILLVTKLDRYEYSPEQALEKFRPFIKKYSRDQYGRQKHSWGINFPNVHIDVVPVVAPSISERGILGQRKRSSYPYIVARSDLPRIGNYHTLLYNNRSTDWKDMPLYIPNAETNRWEETDPIGITEWTKDKSCDCNGNYTKVVKCLKWWRRQHYPAKKYLKGYSLEYLVGLCCPDDIRYVEEGIVLTLEEIVRRGPQKPFTMYNQIPAKNVLDSVSYEEYRAFYDSVCKAAVLCKKSI